MGGHCIPIDPHYLSWKLRTLHYNARFIELAGEINTAMPRYWVQQVQDKLNDAGKAVKGSQILVLGVAYKKDVRERRESSALDSIHCVFVRKFSVPVGPQPNFRIGSCWKRRGPPSVTTIPMCRPFNTRGWRWWG